MPSLTVILTNKYYIQWQVRFVDGSDGLYSIQALADRTIPPHGFTVTEVESGAPVLYSGPPTAFRIQPVPEEDMGPDANAYRLALLPLAISSILVFVICAHPIYVLIYQHYGTG